jgi:hypothetical protein
MHPVTSFRPQWTGNAHPSNGLQRMSVLYGPERFSPFGFGVLDLAPGK